MFNSTKLIYTYVHVPESVSLVVYLIMLINQIFINYLLSQRDSWLRVHVMYTDNISNIIHIVFRYLKFANHGVGLHIANLIWENFCCQSCNIYINGKPAVSFTSTTNKQSLGNLLHRRAILSTGLIALGCSSWIHKVHIRSSAVSPRWTPHLAIHNRTIQLGASQTTPNVHSLLLPRMLMLFSSHMHNFEF